MLQVVVGNLALHVAVEGAVVDVLRFSALARLDVARRHAQPVGHGNAHLVAVLGETAIDEEVVECQQDCARHEEQPGVPERQAEPSAQVCRPATTCGRRGRAGG